MAEVFSKSPCSLGKRVLSPHAQLDFSSKKRRFGQEPDQGSFDRPDAAEFLGRPSSPFRAGKRARPLSPLQPTAHAADFGGRGSLNDAFGFSQQQQHRQAQWRGNGQDAEMAALRSEVGALRAHAAEKESGFVLAREENARLKSSVGMYQKEVERLSGENRILRRAVGIQNTKGKEVEGQLHSLQQATAQAAEYVKRLEQTNYALSVRVQAMGNPGPNDFMGGQRPPDVF
ncbi:unnamed protein product [Ascophyllum nodosum]